MEVTTEAYSNVDWYRSDAVTDVGREMSVSYLCLLTGFSMMQYLGVGLRVPDIPVTQV